MVSGGGGEGGGGHTKETVFGRQTANSNNWTTLLQHIRPDLATVYKNEVTQLKK